MVGRWTPEWPIARLAALSASTRRTTGSGNGAPTPHMCESTRRRCSSRISAGAIRVVASLPKPVLTP